MFLNYHTEFLTASIYKWQRLLQDDYFKNIILDSFDWLVSNKRCIINCFVIMPNHIHLLWKISDGFERKEVQGALFSFTAHAFKKELTKNSPTLLNNFYVNTSDRKFEFWQEEPMVKECWTEKFFLQKLNYIHFNPCQYHWKLAKVPENYKWSSANFYENDVKEFPFLTHFR